MEVLDTHKTVKKLIASGMSEEIAEAIVDVMMMVRNDIIMDTSRAIEKLIVAGLHKEAAEGVVEAMMMARNNK